MKKVVIFIVIVCVILIAGAIYLSLTEKNNPESNQGNTQIVGGDKDVHGCIGSAGYAWCEAKNKCLRAWEEACYDNAEEEIQYQLALKYEKSISDVTVKATKKNENYMVGSISFVTKNLPAPGEGGVFMAAKNSSGVWMLIFDGNGSIDCASIKANYKFTADMLIGFCD